jgi:hypothetical protein
MFLLQCQASLSCIENATQLAFDMLHTLYIPSHHEHVASIAAQITQAAIRTKQNAKVPCLFGAGGQARTRKERSHRKSP